MSFFYKTFLFIAIQAFVTSSWASFPRGCEVKGFSYSENFLLLNETEDQTFFLLQNISDTPIEIQHHETKEVFMSPSLQATLSPQNWAAFASDIHNIHFKCYKLLGDELTMVQCRDVLEVCQYPRVKFALSNMGNYWVSINKSQNQVIQDAIAKGILLRW